MIDGQDIGRRIIQGFFLIGWIILLFGLGLGFLLGKC